jgi:hypothetical protein
MLFATSDKGNMLLNVKEFSNKENHFYIFINYGSTLLPIQGALFLQGVRRQEREADFSFPTTAKVTKPWIQSYHPSIHLYDVVFS